MHDVGLGLAIDGGRDGELRAGDDQHARIARLAAAGGIEDRAVECDAGGAVRLGDGDDGRLAFRQIGIVAKQELGPASGHRQEIDKGHRRLFQPGGHCEPLLAQEGGIVDLRCIAEAVVAQNGHDGMAGRR